MEDMSANSTHLNIPTTTLIQSKDSMKKIHMPTKIRTKLQQQQQRKRMKNNMFDKNTDNININEVDVEDKEDDNNNNNIIHDDHQYHLDDKEEVERKIRALQRIVPGGESLGVDRLFEETAGYIMALQCQLKAMKALASFFEGLEKEKRMFGG